MPFAFLSGCFTLGLSMEDSKRLTFRFERWRAFSGGIIETAGTTFLLLIAVKQFQAGATAKALVAAAGSVGLMLSPLSVSVAESLKLPTARAASRLLAFGALCFLVMAALPFLPVFVLGSVLALTSGTAAIPLVTQMYQDNYPEKERGRLFSKTVMIRIATAAVFSHLAGLALTDRIDRFPWLLLCFGAAMGLGSYALHRCPSRPLVSAGGTHPFRSLRFAREDPLFRRTLVCWMLMGFANLMMLPLRVEYLANPKYGLALNAASVALLVGVIPNVARLILSPLWGWLFDHMNFFALRVVLNLGYAIGIISFFTGQEMWALVAGAIVFGVANAGGDVAWSLWVTKFAAPERVADYMSVHTFFTGVRGLLAPLAAFHLASQVSLATLGWLSMGMILASCLLLLPEIKWGKSARPASALVEEVSE
ncbi:MAG: hypothetical protein AB1705_02780 [Verrucomicrobiota bacterium]